jgi:small GTP-binding protein
MEGKDDHQLSFKFVLVGDSAVGKTAICKQFCEHQFNSKLPQTVGLEFGTRTIDVQGTRIKLQIWDTAGQEKFRSITRAYFRSSTAVFLVFDVTNRDSFSHVSEWTDDAVRLAPVNALRVLIGNKTDLTTQRAVSTAEAQDFASQSGLTYFETSALSGERIDDAFLETAYAAYRKFVDGKMEVAPPTASPASGDVVNIAQKPAEKSSCC